MRGTSPGWSPDQRPAAAEAAAETLLGVGNGLEVRTAWRARTSALPPGTGVLLHRTPGPAPAVRRGRPAPARRRVAFDGPWTVERLSPNALVLDRCELGLSPGDWWEGPLDVL